MKSALLFPFRLLRDLAHAVLTFLPGESGIRLRRFYYGRRFRSCGRNLVVDAGVRIDHPDQISVGDDVHIESYCIISAGPETIGDVRVRPNPHFRHERGELVIGSHVHIVQFCIIIAKGGVEIGNHCTLSAGTKLYSLSNVAVDHNDKSKVLSIMPYDQAPFVLSPISLAENVWLGLDCLVMPGVSVGRDSFAVSQSLLRGEYSENVKLKGNPATVVGPRFVLGAPQ